MNKIEFYMNRDLGERFSASAEFIRQNWKVMYKIILIVAIPLALLQGYYQQHYMSAYLRSISQIVSGGDASMVRELYTSSGMWIYLLISLLSALVLSAMSGAIMSRYEEGLLNEETTLSDLGDKIVSNMGKLLMIGLAMILLGIVAIFALVLIIMVMSKISGFFTVLVAIFAVFSIVPAIYLVRFPALFQEASPMESIKDGLRLGFKGWGTTMLMIIIIAVAAYVVTLIFSLPFAIWNAFNIGNEPGILSYSLSGISWLGKAFVTPLTFVFFAFQYFAVVDKVDGISLQSKVEEFDNL